MIVNQWKHFEFHIMTLIQLFTYSTESITF
jgi:hypothetical protein